MYDLILEELKKQGKTFAWLSKKTGINQAVFSTMKARNTGLSLEYGVKVAKALHIPVERLLIEKQDESN